MPTVPRVFVASSREAIPYAKGIKRNLGDAAEVIVWPQAGYRPGEILIDELNRHLRQSDFGVFVFAPDDIVMVRGQKQRTVRDNVVLELGMFVGRLGRKQSFIVQPKGGDMRLPTDLIGVITAQYDPERAQRKPAAALGMACNQIADAIRHQNRLIMNELNQAVTESLETVCWSMSAPFPPWGTSLRAFIFKEEKDELVCWGFWDPYNRSAEKVGKTRFRINKKMASKVVVVRCYKDNAPKRTSEIERSSVAPLPSGLKGVRGKIKPGIKYILAAPILDENGKIWGVVDFDASNDIGRQLLKNEETSNAVIMRLARDLSKILTR